MRISDMMTKLTGDATLLLARGVSSQCDRAVIGPDQWHGTEARPRLMSIALWDTLRSSLADVGGWPREGL